MPYNTELGAAALNSETRVIRTDAGVDMADISSEETTVVATYTSRHDAEVAKSFLDDRGISAFVVADDVHPPIQLTEGVRLFVMEGRAHEARAALEAADMAGGASETGAETASETGAEAGSGTRISAWFYLAGFLLLVLAIVAALVL